MSDTVGIDLDDLDDLKDILDEKRSVSGFDLQKVFAHLVLNWQWYLLSVIICLGCAFFYLRYTRPIYQVAARMLVKDEDENPRTSIRQILPNMEEFGIMEMARTGDVALERGMATINDSTKERGEFNYGKSVL